MSHLKLNALRVRGRVGCKEPERAHPQMLKIDLRIDYDMRAAIASDDVGDAIDYKQVASCVRELLAAREWRLIEKMAFDIAVSVSGLHPTITTVEVGVTKDVITDVASVTAVVSLDR